VLLNKRRDLLVLLQTWTSYEEGKLEEIIDIDIRDDLDVEEACRLLKIGLLCTQDVMKLRPSMTNLVQMLIGERAVSMDKVAKPVVISDGDLKADNQQRQTGALSPVMKSFATTSLSISSEATTQSSL
jgi:hypothetical protein